MGAFSGDFLETSMIIALSRLIVFSIELIVWIDYI